MDKNRLASKYPLLLHLNPVAKPSRVMVRTVGAAIVMMTERFIFASVSARMGSLNPTGTGLAHYRLMLGEEHVCAIFIGFDHGREVIGKFVDFLYP